MIVGVLRESKAAERRVALTPWGARIVPDAGAVIDAAFAGTTVRTRAVDQLDLEDELPRADAIIGAVLVAGARAPQLLERSHLAVLRPGAVLVVEGGELRHPAVAGALAAVA